MPKKWNLELPRKLSNFHFCYEFLYFHDFSAKTSLKKDNKDIFGISVASSIEPYIIQRNRFSAILLHCPHLTIAPFQVDWIACCSNTFVSRSIWWQTFGHKFHSRWERTRTNCIHCSDANSTGGKWTRRFLLDKKKREYDRRTCRLCQAILRPPWVRSVPDWQR